MIINKSLLLLIRLRTNIWKILLLLGQWGSVPEVGTSGFIVVDPDLWENRDDYKRTAETIQDSKSCQ